MLNYVASRGTRKPKGKVFAFFADLKAAFDKINRDNLEERMREMGVTVRLRNRIMETYRYTRNVAELGDKRSEEFHTNRVVRQGCPLSPTLFNIYIADLEEEMKKERVGSIVIGKAKIWTLSYADDIALLATEEGEMKGMIKRLRRYLERKELLLSPEKSKILVFEKGKGRRREWKWDKEKRIAEVKEMTYLGYIVQKNGGCGKHLEERKRRALLAAKNT